jgi:hypothetical protein
MSMVEKVARAIDVAGTTWLNEQPWRVEWYDVPGEVLARAAIEAMREPSEEMLAAAESGYTLSNPYCDYSEAAFKRAVERMIDAALKEPEARPEQQSDLSTPR